jgi:hypothetical protein
MHACGSIDLTQGPSARIHAMGKKHACVGSDTWASALPSGEARFCSGAEAGHSASMCASGGRDSSAPVSSGGWRASPDAPVPVEGSWPNRCSPSPATKEAALTGLSRLEDDRTCDLVKRPARRVRCACALTSQNRQLRTSGAGMAIMIASSVWSAWTLGGNGRHAS